MTELTKKNTQLGVRVWNSQTLPLCDMYLTTEPGMLIGLVFAPALPQLFNQKRKLYHLHASIFLLIIS